MPQVLVLSGATDGSLRDSCTSSSSARMGGGGALKKRTTAEIACVPTWVDCALGTACGFVSACSAAPFILTVDRAVTENSAGKSPLGAALRRGLTQVFTRPHVMLTSLPYWMVAGVYGSTYMAANCIDAICEHNLDQDADNTKTIHGAVKLGGVTAVNMCAGVAKVRPLAPRTRRVLNHCVCARVRLSTLAKCLTL